MNEHDLYLKLRDCPTPDVVCRMHNIHIAGISGLESAFGARTTHYISQKPGPSFSTIEKAMNLVLKGLGWVLGKELKLFTKAFKLMYKPHFKVLKAFDESFDRYWDGLSFTRWAFEVVHDLPERVHRYVYLTGNFDFQKTMLAMAPLNPHDSDEVLRELKSTAAILVEFDSMLLEDLAELLKALEKGLEQVENLKFAKTQIDQIALYSIYKELSMVYLQITPGLNKLYRELVGHCDSWRQLLRGKLGIHFNFQNEIRNIVVRMQSVLELLDQKAQGGK